MNASKEKIGPAEAVKMARGFTKLVVAKGKKIVTVAMKDEPADDEITKLIIGPSGNLRAPTWKRGKTLVVGFNADAYASVFS